jgi:hypothetical protein
MNRQQRRKAAKVSEVRMKPVRELVAAGHRCAGVGCEASFDGDMPPGWKWVVYYWAPQPEISHWTSRDWVQKPYRDICLCPEHARAFEALLISFGDELAGPAAGMV